MSATSQAGVLAQKGLGLLWSATVAGASGISDAITKAKKHYGDYCEKDQLDNLRKQGKRPVEILLEAMQRFHYLSLAGYDNEAAAAARKLGIKISEYEKSSVPLDAVLALGGILVDSSLRYGDFSKSSWLNLSDYLNSSRMGKDHYDRDSLVNHFYYAIVLLHENCGGVNDRFVSALKEAAGKLVEGSSYQVDDVGYNRFSASSFSYGSMAGSTSLPSYAQPSNDLPAYARVPSATSATPAPQSYASSGSKAPSDPKVRQAKTLYVIASSIKKAADESEQRRQRSLKEAEEMLRRERTGFGSKTGISAAPSGGSYGSNSNYSNSSSLI